MTIKLKFDKYHNTARKPVNVNATEYRVEKTYHLSPYFVPIEVYLTPCDPHWIQKVVPYTKMIIRLSRSKGVHTIKRRSMERFEFSFFPQDNFSKNLEFFGVNF